MNLDSSNIIGRAVHVHFPELDLVNIPARVDTGARTSAIWASGIKEHDGKLIFNLFDSESPFYTGAELTFYDYGERMVANSFGTMQLRYTVRLLISVEGRKVRALFTLADRSHQVYPILIGRNILRGKFIVDVKKGTPLLKEERDRSRQLKVAYTKLRKKGM